MLARDEEKQLYGETLYDFLGVTRDAPPRTSSRDIEARRRPATPTRTRATPRSTRGSWTRTTRVSVSEYAIDATM